jgi:hypothetical protein
MNFTSLTVISAFFLAHLAVSEMSAQSNGLQRPISGTSYSYLLDGTVLAQYNFSDEVVVVTGPGRTFPRSESTRTVTAASLLDQQRYSQVSAYDILGVLLCKESNVLAQDIMQLLDKYRSQPLFVVTVEANGRLHRRILW